MRVQITFKGGAQIVIDADEIKTGRSPVSGDLQQVTWNTPEDWTAKLHGIYDLSEVVAIVVMRDANGGTIASASAVDCPARP